MIAIIDYQTGNIGSILNMLKKIGAEASVVSDAKGITEADKLILPGVGAFDTGMRNLEQLNLVPLLNAEVKNRKKPILGICLGMQLLAKKSEEGVLDGLAWLDAKVIKFAFGEEHRNLKIPHMGWNTIVPKRESPLLAGLDSSARFYFVHSYHLKCGEPDDVAATTMYGYEFPSVVQRENIYGVEFHPEKSHKFGIRLLKNFAELC
ncbi:MAG: imidazole glycerol phosphate synthase subunit HisH [bacterium]|nr:imidazole glycerol phosphate synthase subunit HisH [bacterium]